MGKTRATERWAKSHERDGSMACTHVELRRDVIALSFGRTDS
jgi:hypothetical protein